MKRLVIDADDLGMSRSINAGIARGISTGLVREVSLCVNGAAVDHGIATVAGCDVGVGLHFTLTQGVALAGPLRGLTHRDGRFLPLTAVLAACVSGRVLERDVERELAAQLAGVRARGFEPSHLNGHHHVHIFPVVRDVVIRVAAQERIRHVRVPIGSERPRLLPRSVVLAVLARAFEKRGRDRLPPAPRVVGLEPADRELLDRALEGLHSDAEWIVHPREPDPQARVPSRFAIDHGQLDLELLLDPELPRILRRHGFEPGRFAEIGGAN